MANIKFNYLYRDGGNWKKYAAVVFSNPTELSLAEIDGKIRMSMKPDALFIAHQLRLREAFLFSGEGYVSVEDHCFHEYDSIEQSPQLADDESDRTIDEFLRELENIVKTVGWQLFDPCDRFMSLERISRLT